jgi:serine/threonine protein kinase
MKRSKLMGVKDIFSSISYEVTGLLATDGWGELYRAVYVPHGTDVLFRRLPPALASDEAAWKLAVAELRAWSRLEHGGIVPVMEWGVLEGEAFLATRLPAGTRLADSEPLDEPVADAAFSSLLEAMAEAAKYGVLHLGLCPGNIWVDGGSAAVSDFGLWYVARDFPGSGVPDELFLAPEQSSSSTVGSPADVYSLGMAYLVMRCGVEAARDAAATGVMPEGLGDRGKVIERCLQASPLARYGSVIDLGKAFSPSPSPGRDACDAADCPVCAAKARLERAAGMKRGRESSRQVSHNLVSCAWLLVAALAVATLLVWWIALR